MCKFPKYYFLSICFCFFIESINCFDKDDLQKFEKENHEDEYDKFPAVQYSLADADKSDVTFRLFTKTRPSDGILVNEDTVRQLNFNKTHPTKFLVHGWLSNETTYWYRPMKDAYFKKGNYNVVFVDWSKAGSKSFEVSAANIKKIGEFVAEFIIKADFAPENVHIIGHSLGSHLAGFAGKFVFEKIGKKIGRITATDPAGPGFENKEITEENRLSPSDADFVDVVHTDIGHYGFIKPLGHVDFYPNGGFQQPGYSQNKDDANYSHARSNYFFIESIHKPIRAFSCKSWEQFTDSNCGDTVLFGEDITKSARGIYFFRTNPDAPFALD